MIDTHSHFLPEVDDGADSVECALKILQDIKCQGVDTVVSTSHYYEWQEDISNFLSRREQALNILNENIKQNSGNYPNIVIGAEVALTPETPKSEDLKKLCIGDTNNILIELPYSGYHEWIPFAIFEITSRHGLTPVLAHFERFCTTKSKLQQYKELLSLDVKVQINTESLLYRSPYKVVKHLVKEGKVDIIGSDTHNMTSRKCTFADGVKKIEKKFGKEFLTKLDNNAKKIIGLR